MALVDNSWKNIFRKTGNFMRKNICKFESVNTDVICVVGTAINGDGSARIYEIRVYEE